MKVQLGGNRLGSGNKLQVDLHEYGRSTHDLGYVWRSSMSAGTLVPFLSEIGLPGDTFDIDLDADVKTHPTIGPLFGSYKVQLDIFTADMRLYQGRLHNNKLKAGMDMAQIKLPYMLLNAEWIDPATTQQTDFGHAQINPSSILAYLGLMGIGFNPDEGEPIPREFNALSYLSYWDIYKNYYANKQEEIGVVIHTPVLTTPKFITEIEIASAPLTQAPLITGPPIVATFGTVARITYTTGSSNRPDLSQVLLKSASSAQKWPVSQIFNVTAEAPGIIDLVFNTAGIPGDGLFENWDYAAAADIPIGPIKLQTFDLDNLDDMREYILSQAASLSPVEINALGKAPYSLILDGNQPALRSSQEGLGIKTYQADLFNNWLSQAWIEGVNGITERTAVDTSGGSFSMDQLNISQKIYEMLNRFAMSDGSYDSWIAAAWTPNRFTRPEIPQYVGGLSKELVFQEVVSNTETVEQPLGTLAGKGVMAKKHKGGQVTIKVNEPCYIIGIVSLTPRIDYSQGNRWDMHLRTMDDLHKPALDEIGFQDLITEQMVWSETEFAGPNWQTKTAGKQPAWLNYMTNYNRTYGNFAIENNEMWMTLNRRYDVNMVTGLIEDLTTYVDPEKYNQIFAQPELTSQNFWVQIGVDIQARRIMSGKLMPRM